MLISQVIDHAWTKFDEAIDGAYTKMIEEMTWLPTVLDNLAAEFEPQYDLCDVDGEVISCNICGYSSKYDN